MHWGLHPRPDPALPNVLQALALPPLSHVSPEFVQIFQESLRMTRQVVHASPASTVFLLAGSGTLGWDQVGANLVERGDRALVLHTGYFGDGFRECLKPTAPPSTRCARPWGAPCPSRHRARAPHRAHRGRRARVQTRDNHARRHLHRRAVDARAIAAISVRAADGRAGRGVLARVGGRADGRLGPGRRTEREPEGARRAARAERAPREPARDGGVAGPEGGVKSGAFYSSWEKWAPIMQAYDAGRPAYFGTPAVGVVRAYHASLLEITAGPLPLPTRLALHAAAAARITSAAAALGMRPSPQIRASAQRHERALRAGGYKGRDRVKAAAVLGAVGRRGVVMAGGLAVGEEGVRERYIRVGHMGWSVVGEGGRDVERMVRALEEAVREEVGKAEAEGRGAGLARL
ncbi:hypothetical protein BJ912DRAFT_922319 [Pholiota molesta]|nr:hypothetical protein BJ912DRAFT_922319 [Pholiota molesta]